MALKAGDKAPDFEVSDQNGKTVKLSDFQGKKVVLYFYPQDNTPTCTVEACNLRDNFSALKAKGYEVLGVSPDSAKKHTNFIKKFSLPFTLLADTDNKIIESYGLWAEKQMFGKKYMGVLRTTFIIDEKGIIERIIDDVKSKEHAEQILG
ncbi:MULTISPECIES: thioredoxin-dependent thiol peroxidase [unclassified Imperialibacter]|uniref:thioredoxin-dependent thiol peroxidase n=1 Tax=unclassified Imperialibacter TaxID=2629706 RepID=UPI00125C16D7|nr:MULTISPECIES: thioredoxin-dependent thiol peroxidase [unclassified Imperialibacter]CAD5252724.1 putative peroxiredoxin bcp [Imperialibacter sp. 75]CAD5280930.1 putative peroxiredoxin bcp [Imperialibacter sp. 89]VVT28838.1 putative peroxiredoxin bcp [Imperialibacter sp. EC-SDR9]